MISVIYALVLWSIDGSYFKDKRNRAAGHRGHEGYRATEDRASVSHIVVSCECAATHKNTLIEHARKSRVRHNVKSVGNRHNSLKIQRNCVKYSSINL